MDVLYGLIFGLPVGFVLGMCFMTAMQARWTRQDEEKEFRQAVLAWLRKVDL